MRDSNLDQLRNDQQMSSVHVRKSGPKVAQKKWPKTDSRYWRDKLVTRGKSGFFVRLQRGGRREWFALNTSEREAGAMMARDIYLEVSSTGIAATSAKLKPGSEKISGEGLTIGEFVSAVEATGKLSRLTLRGYVHCLRIIISEVFGVDGGRERFDHRKGGAMRWAEKVDRIKVVKITSERIERWKLDRLKSAGEGSKEHWSAKRTCNTYIRGARSLFSARLMRHIPEWFRPACNPFKDVEMFESGDMRYRSQIDLSALLKNAREDLKNRNPSAYIAFLLAIGAGLRRKEIDLLQWDMVDFSSGMVRLRQTEVLQLKTTGSSDDVKVDAVLLGELSAFRTSSCGFFVIPSSLAPQVDPRGQFYRCGSVFDELIEWLRGQGVTANKPIHELRKEVGALITSQQGLYDASRFLRHSDPTTTARHYADLKWRKPPGLDRFWPDSSGPSTIAEDAA
jgi:integrase